MPATAQTFSPGMPVAIGEIDRELKKLWEQTAGTATRASLVNLAIYSEEPDSLARNTEIISRITEDHACRALVIGANRGAAENHADAWISAHCHTGGAGHMQVCSEQLSFALEGPCVRLLPSIVFSHLDSDLPFYLWWQGEFHDPMDPQLWSWVDRLIYDSRAWRDVGEQLRLVETAQEEAKQRVVLCDLNWTRLVHVRLALAQFFDHDAGQDYLSKIAAVEIDHAPDSRSTALLLAGWMAAQLEWKMADERKESPQFRDASGKNVTVTLRARAGHPIGRCVLSCGGEQEFCVERRAQGDLLEISAGAPNDQRASQLMPAGGDAAVDLMIEELMHGGPHRVYLRALHCVRDLL